MVDRINKTAVRRSFDRAAPEYAKSSTMQRAVAARLLSLAAPCKPEQILAGGVGSGSELPFLHRLFPAAKLTALDLSLQMLRIARRHSSSCICADMEKLPLKDAAFDLVFSNLCLHWCNQPGLVIAECKRVLHSKGVILLSVCGPQTLRELRSSWEAVEGESRTLDFPNRAFLQDLFQKQGLQVQVFHTQREVIEYGNFYDLLSYLRTCGVKDLRADRARPIKSGVLAKVERYYMGRWSNEGKTTATYEYYFIKMRKIQGNYQVWS